MTCLEQFTSVHYQTVSQTEDSVLKILKNMDENKAAGLDNLSGKFLKDGATILAKPLPNL